MTPPPSHHNSCPHSAVAIQSFLRRLMGGGGAAPPPLSLRQVEELQQLHQRVAVPYDGANPAHVQMLLRLWRLAWPDVPPPPADNVRSEGWKDMGWQVGPPQ